jgi:hypothetical protein
VGTGLIVPGAEPPRHRSVLYGPSGAPLRIVEAYTALKARLVRLDECGRPYGPATELPVTRVTSVRDPEPHDTVCVTFDTGTVRQATLTATFTQLAPRRYRL